MDRNALLRQLEYYFSDVAFPYDDFLQGEADEAGSIPAETLAASPRLVSMTPDLTVEARTALLLELVAESASLGSPTVKKVGEDRLSRVHPLPLEDAAAPRSVYISGAPKDASEEILKAQLSGSSAAADFEPVVSVRRLRDVQKDRSYSGQLFVECEDATKAAALCKAAAKGAAGVTCTKVKLLCDFFKGQHESILEQREKRAAKAAGGGGAAGSKREREAPAPPTAEELAAAAAKRKAEAAEFGKLVLRFEGAGESADREGCEALCKTFQTEECKLAFVDFARGETNGHLRFTSTAGAEAALTALSSGGAELGGAAPTWRVLDEAEAEAYFDAYTVKRDERRAQGHKRHKGGGKGGKGKGGGRGRGRGRW